MTHEEFEKLAGYEVSLADYQDIIEPMYMATNLDKQDFVECINKKRFALVPLKNLIKEMKECAASLKESCTHYIDNETQERLDDLVEQYIERRYPNLPIDYSYEDEQLWSCYYPVRVNIGNRKTYKTYETIDLF